ncbi:MAG: hypothetical protein IIZ94_07240 [Prevotella sp.]|nr:hypothetical protein [Prevotella sp.]
MFKFIPIAILIGLAGCTTGKESHQVLLRQMTTDLMETYTLAAQATDPFMKDEVPGVKISQKNKDIIKTLNVQVYNEIESLVQSVNENQTLTDASVQAAETALKNFQACWLSIKSSGEPSEECQ